MTCQAAFHIKNSVFITYLLEDEQELSLGILIRLQRIYNFFIVPCCFIINIGCFIIILQSFYIIFGTNLLTQCQVPVAVFCMFFTSQEINTKRSPNAVKLFVDFFRPKDIQWAGEVPGGAPRGAQPIKACLEAEARPGGLCPPQVPPGPPLCSINTPIFPKPQGSRQNIHPAAAESRTTRSNLDTISDGVHHLHWCLSDDA